MKSSDLKKLADQFGAVVVLDGETPSFVFLSFQKYQELLGGNEARLAKEHFSKVATNGPGAGLNFFQNSPEEIELVEKLNKEIMALREEIKLRESEATE